MKLDTRIEKRNVLVPLDAARPEREHLVFETAILRAEAENFGLHVIDLERIREILAAYVREREDREQLIAGATCQTCGMKAMHALASCAVPSSAHAHEFVYDMGHDHEACTCGETRPSIEGRTAQRERR